MATTRIVIDNQIYEVSQPDATGRVRLTEIQSGARLGESTFWLGGVQYRCEARHINGSENVVIAKRLDGSPDTFIAEAPTVAAEKPETEPNKLIGIALTERTVHDMEVFITTDAYQWLATKAPWKAQNGIQLVAGSKVGDEFMLSIKKFWLSPETFCNKRVNLTKKFKGTETIALEIEAALIELAKEIRASPLPNKFDGMKTY